MSAPLYTDIFWLSLVAGALAHGLGPSNICDLRPSYTSVHQCSTSFPNVNYSWVHVNIKRQYRKFIDARKYKVKWQRGLGGQKALSYLCKGSFRKFNVTRKRKLVTIFRRPPAPSKKKPTIRWKYIFMVILQMGHSKMIYYYNCIGHLH